MVILTACISTHCRRLHAAASPPQPPNHHLRRPPPGLSGMLDLMSPARPTAHGSGSPLTATAPPPLDRSPKNSHSTRAPSPPQPQLPSGRPNRATRTGAAHPPRPTTSPSTSARNLSEKITQAPECMHCELTHPRACQAFLTSSGSSHHASPASSSCNHKQSDRHGSRNYEER